MHPKYPVLVPIYFAEADERLGSLQDAAEILLHVPRDPHAWALVRRTAHALAGNSAMMGFDDVAETARRLEHRAVEIAAQGADPDDVLIVDRGLEVLRSLIRSLRRAHGLEES